MSIKGFTYTEYSCDVDGCHNFETVEEGSKVEVQWRSIAMDLDLPHRKDFQFCPLCAAKIFGKDFVHVDELEKAKAILRERE